MRPWPILIVCSYLLIRVITVDELPPTEAFNVTREYPSSQHHEDIIFEFITIHQAAPQQDNDTHNVTIWRQQGQGDWPDNEGVSNLLHVNLKQLRPSGTQLKEAAHVNPSFRGSTKNLRFYLGSFSMPAMLEDRLSIVILPRVMSRFTMSC